MKTLTLTTGENVYIYDDVFDANECEYYNKFAQNSLFKCNYNSSMLNEHMTYAALTSPFNDKDVENFQFFQSKNFGKVKHHFKNMHRFVSWITLIKMMPEVYYHVDDSNSTNSNTMSMIYYVNMEWNINYGGETIICNSKGEPELAIATKPNRIAIYSSKLMHKPSGISPKAFPNRFTFVSLFK